MLREAEKRDPGNEVAPFLSKLQGIRNGTLFDDIMIQTQS